MKHFILAASGTLSLIWLLFFAGLLPLQAHPLGGVQQKTMISILPGALLVEYKTHFGPEVLLPLHPDRNLDGHLDNTEQAAFLTRIHDLLLPNLVLKANGTPLILEEITRNLTLEDSMDFTMGLRSEFTFRAAPQAATLPANATIAINDRNFRTGELDQLNYSVSVLGDTGPLRLVDGGRTLIISGKNEAATAATQDPQLHLTDNKNGHNNEAGPLIDFLRDTRSSVVLTLAALATAFILGAFHALSPGHGKAMVAAYLVGSRGRIIDAVHLGVVVTVTHVFSVIILGVAALLLSHYTLAENIYPWLGVVSGVLIFATGYLILARNALAGLTHHHGNDHHHHQHAPSDHSFKEILSLGIAGGLVPCPSAIVILLFGIAINRITTGLLLIFSFSLGLAAVLILIGILTITASNRLEGFSQRAGWIRRLPIFTAGIIMVLGVAIGINSLLQAGILSFHP